MYKVGSANFHLAIDPAHIRQALRDWASVKQLGENPAAKSEIVSMHQKQCGYSDTPAGRGLALREVIQEAVLSLQPESSKPVLEDKRWRPYLIISEQYQKGRSPDWLCEQMHISRATYYLEQQRALEILTGTLQSWQEKAALQQAIPRASIWDLRPEKARKVFMVPPRANQVMVGRHELLKQLSARLLDQGGHKVAALHGLPGAGKTSLAVELAYDDEIQREYEDGVLWAGLGQTPNLNSVLSAWAEELQIDPQIVSSRDTLPERIILIRSAIGLRKLLIVVDDAWTIEAALALKLGGPNCGYLLTTRQANLAVEFAGLSVFRVEELNEEDGLALLKEYAPVAVETDPQLARELVRSVGALPLALVLMGSYLQVRSVNEQPRRIQEAMQSLNRHNSPFSLRKPLPPLESHPGLPASEPVSLQAVIGLSETALPANAQKAFHTLSLFPAKPNTFSELAALSVCECCTQDLDALVDGGLLETAANDRYRMHQAIHDYARLKLTGSPPAARMAAYYLHWIKQDLPGPQQLGVELANLAAACQLAFQHNEDKLAIELVSALFDYLEVHGFYELASNLLGQAHQAADRLNDPAAQADLLMRLGNIEVSRGQFSQASVYLLGAVSTAKDKGLLSIEASALFNLGMARLYAGDTEPGIDDLMHALSLARALEDPMLQVYDLNGLGFACQEAAQFGQAKGYLNEAVILAGEYNLPRGLGWAHQNLCMLELQTGQFDLAREDSRACVRVYQTIGDRRGTAWQMYHLGRIDRQTGDYDSAVLRFESALSALEELGDWMGKGFCVHNLGLLAAEKGDWIDAWNKYQQALNIFDSISCQSGVAQCLHSQAQMYRYCGNPIAAIPLLESALNLREKVSFRRGVGLSTAVHAVSLYESGQVLAGLGGAARAVQLFRELETPSSLAYGLLLWGRMQFETNHFVEAVSAYKEALQVRAELNQNHLCMELQVGLAASALQLGKEDWARQAGEEAIGSLRQMQLGGYQVLDKPGWVYLYLGRIMDALGHTESARDIWRWGKLKICKQSECLPEIASRAGYLYKISENQALMEMDI